MNPTWLYVAAVYAAAIALARRAGVQMPGRVAVLFYLIVLGYLLEPMTSRTVNVHADVVRTLPPWSFIAEEHGTHNPTMNDVPLQMVPWAHSVRESWKSLQAPIWNATTGCGMPLLGNGQSSALSPIRLLALPLNLGHAMTAEAAMKFLIALTFTYLFCRRRWSEEGSVIGAVTFAFSGFLFAWLHFPHTTTVCLSPAVFYVIDLIAERPSFGRCAFAGAIGAAVVFGGHPETAAQMAFVAFLYVLWLRPSLRKLAAMGGALVIALLLAAPHLAMFAESVTRSKRFADLQVKAWSDERLPDSEYRSVIPMLLPRYFGPLNRPFGPAVPDGVTGFVGALALAAWFAVAWQVIASRKWTSAEAFFVLLAVLIFGALYEWPGFTDLFNFVIPLSAHARLRHVLGLALAILAAAAIDHSRIRRAPLLTGLGIVAIGLVALFAYVEFPYAVRDRRPMAILLAIPAAVVIITGAVAVSWRKMGAYAALIIAVVAEMYTGGRGFNSPAEESLLYPRTPVIEKLEQLQATAAEPFRVTGLGPMLFQNIPAIFRFEDIRVHDPMANARYFDFLARTAVFKPDEYFAFWDDQASHVLDFLNVRYVMADPGVVISDRSRYALRYEGPDGRIYENTTVLPRFYAPRNVVVDFDDKGFDRRLREMDDKWSHTALLDELELENQQMHDDFFNARAADSPEARVKIVESSAREYRLTTTAPRYTLVASSIPWWPGWKVERNGKRIDPIRVNSAFLGFAVPPGETNVRVWYDPWTWKVGAGVSLVTIIALIVIGTFYSTARARANPPAPAAG